MNRGVEAAFRPAAIEIEQTPPSPAGRAVVWAILGVMALAIAWAALSRIDVVAVAHGRIIPSGHSKRVQAPERGVVAGIHVEEGQRVRAGDLLLELDDDSVRADMNRLSGERDSVEAEMARCRQILHWLAGESAPAAEQIEAAADPLLARQWYEHQARLAVLAHRREQKKAERISAQRQAEKLDAVLPIVSRKARDQKRLADQKLLSEQQYLATEQQRRETYHDLRTGRSRVLELAAAVAALDAQIEHAGTEFHRTVLQRLDDAERRHAALVQELVKASVRLDAHSIRSPVDGVVQQLVVHGGGTVLAPAQELMVIVPESGKLEVEAVLENKDIGFVAVGQETAIKVNTFPFTRYGTIGGKVVNLSRDAVTDEHKGLVYRMRVLMHQASIRVDAREVALSPGMAVTVEVKTGARRLIEFFLSPLLRYRDEGLRER